MIVQNISQDNHATDMTFTLPIADLDRAVATLEGNRDVLQYRELRSDKDVTKLSVIGVGMRSHAGVAQRMFTALADKGINIQVISTSEIKLLLPFIGENTALSAASPSPLPAPPTRPETSPVTDPKIPDCGMPGINCAIATGELATIHTITSFDKKVSCLFLRVFILVTLTQNVNRRSDLKY